MRFEVAVKYGNRWSYKGIYTAASAKSAAATASRAHNRRFVRVRPEDSRDKWLVYQVVPIKTSQTKEV